MIIHYHSSFLIFTVPKSLVVSMLNWQMCSGLDSKTNVFVHNEKTLKKARLKEWRNGESTLMQIMEVMKVPDLEFYGFFSQQTGPSFC